MTRTEVFRQRLLRAVVLAGLSGLSLPGAALEVKPEFVPSSKAQEDARRKAEDKASALAAEKQKADDEIRQLKAQLAREKEIRQKAEKPVDLAAPALAPKPAAPTLAAGQVIKDCAECPEMVVIPAGSFVMGSPESEVDRNSDEGPQRRVQIARFALGKTEITQGQWKAVMGSNPSYFKNCGDNCPVENVSWNDAQDFIKKLNAKTGQTYRLPSEAEWEYACRAGGTHTYCGSDKSADVAWHEKNSMNKTHPVAGKRPNAFGLYDMSGNVWEWVQDRWHDNYQGAPTDGTAWESGTDVGRVLRGGSWGSRPRNARSAYRIRGEPASRNNSNGFRPARMLP